MTTCFVLMFATVLYAAPNQHYRRVTQISVHVDCVAEAAEIIRGLPGQNLSSDMHLAAPGSSSAHFERVVSPTEHGHVMNVLRSMGEVVSETENTLYRGQEIRELQARIAGSNLEIQRLQMRMQAARNLDMLVMIDSSLSSAERERDRLQGRLNYLTNSVNQPAISISIWEGLPPELAPYEQSFWTRMGDSFMSSVTVIVAVFGHFVVFMTVAILPLGILGVMGLIAWRIVRRFSQPKVEISAENKEDEVL